MIRLFAAIAIPPDLGQALTSHQHGLRQARWRPIEAFHITMRFFGDIPEDQARDLDEALLDVMGPHLHLSLQGVGAFGEGRDIHAVWAAVTPDIELTRLAQRCERAARTAGLASETRAYKPHVTLAYLNRPDPEAVGTWLSENNLLKSEPFAVDRFGLYSSWQTSEGSRYRLEAEYPLGR